MGKRGRRGGEGSQRLYKLGSVYLEEYQIYTPIRWNDTAPPTPLAYVGHGKRTGADMVVCCQDMSSIFTFFLFRQVESYKSSIRLAADFNARNS